MPVPIVETRTWSGVVVPQVPRWTSATRRGGTEFFTCRFNPVPRSVVLKPSPPCVAWATTLMRAGSAPVAVMVVTPEAPAICEDTVCPESTWVTSKRCDEPLVDVYFIVSGCDDD